MSWIHPYRIAAHAFPNFIPYDFYRKYNPESIKSKRYSIALSLTHFSCHVSRYRRLHHCGDIRLYVQSAQQTRISLFNLHLQTFSTSIHKNKTRKQSLRLNYCLLHLLQLVSGQKLKFGPSHFSTSNSTVFTTGLKFSGKQSHPSYIIDQLSLLL